MEEVVYLLIEQIHSNVRRKPISVPVQIISTESKKQLAR